MLVLVRTGCPATAPVDGNSIQVRDRSDAGQRRLLLRGRRDAGSWALLRVTRLLNILYFPAR